MKLLNCINCHDIFVLGHKPRTCHCGACSGRYINDDDIEVAFATYKPRVFGCRNDKYMQSYYPSVFPHNKDLKLFKIKPDYHKITWVNETICAHSSSG